MTAGCQHGGSKDAGAEASGGVEESPAASAGATSAEAPDGGGFTAVLRIDAAPSYKHFQGVWLEREDGERWVIDYRARPWWRGFEDQRVAVDGERWEPEGQAISATHFKVATLTPIEPPVEAPRSLGPERVIRGRFDLYTWPEGTKLEGETATVFAAEGGARYWLAGIPKNLPATGEAVEIRGREVEPSPFVSRPGGAYLWVAATRREGAGGWSEADYAP